MPYLRPMPAHAVPAVPAPAVDDATLAVVRPILADVAQNGEEAVRAHAERLGDLKPGEPMWYPANALQKARDQLAPDVVDLLERVADRIRRFARAQRLSLVDHNWPVDGGRAGQQWVPMESAGCYAPGGRFPLPSSVLMTAVTARTAGVARVVVASPRPPPVVLAAAAVAGADGLLAVGGAQGVGALTYGIPESPPVSVIVGPGNRYVTAAKALVSSRVAIDFLAGPSELVVIADETADPSWVAADLIGQAEHDPDARVALISLAPGLVEAVEEALTAQLADLPSKSIAAQALSCGYAVQVQNRPEAFSVCDRLAPEHLELHIENPAEAVTILRHFGAAFLGSHTAEVFGDYGVGPNHVLPTGGVARSSGGLSVAHFLRLRTWLVADETPDGDLIDDVVALARLEGLEGHARSAERRRAPPVPR